MSLDKVLITGSNNGLGKYLALHFAKKGHDIILHGRNKERLQEIEKEISKLDVKVEHYICELCSQNELSNLAKFCTDRHIKILINNAGMICPSKRLEDIEIDQINQMIDTNLKAPIILIKSLSKELNNIININSMVGLEVKKSRTLYSASKWGLRGFSNSLKLELDNVNILDVYPTTIKTWAERENAMEIDFVLNKIYDAYQNNELELILDGRPK